MHICTSAIAEEFKKRVVNVTLDAVDIKSILSSLSARLVRDVVLNFICMCILIFGRAVKCNVHNIFQNQSTSKPTAKCL